MDLGQASQLRGIYIHQSTVDQDRLTPSQRRRQTLE